MYEDDHLEAQYEERYEIDREDEMHDEDHYTQEEREES